MKVLIVSRGYPTQKFKTNGIFEFDQAKALAEAGIEVVYAAVDIRSVLRWRKWGYESFVKDGVQVEAINLPGGRIHRRFLNYIGEKALRKLYKRIVNEYGKPDIIHSHFLIKGYTVAKVFRNSDIPMMHTEHLSQLNKREISAYNKFLGQNTYHYMKNVIAVSQSLASSLLKNFNVKAKVIPNIVDTSIFNYKSNNNSINNFSFVSVGGLTLRKGMDLLIKSFYEAFRNNKKVKLYIYGDGPERANLEKLISKLELSNQVFLMGLVNRKIIAKKMQESQCFVLASYLETFGVVFIEAMATGLPVIATKCGGPENFINESNGIVISVENQKQLTQAMLHMFENKDIYNKKEISNKTKEEYGQKTIAQLLIKEYDKILAEK